MTTHVVWLRNDLRLNDNHALYAACRAENAKVLVLFIATPQQWQSHTMAAKQAEFIWQSLQDLQQSLASKGIALHLAECANFTDSVSLLLDFCLEYQADHLFYNYQYEVNERQRDVAVERLLPEHGITVQGFDDSVLLSPGSVLTGKGEMYKVFTPFSKALVKRLQAGLPDCLPAPSVRQSGPLTTLLPLQPFNYPREAIDTTLFPAGEKNALHRLRTFCQQRVQHYAAQRDFPAEDSTSRLSVYLACGVLSPRQCLHRLLHEYPDALDNNVVFVWFNEVIWREFYRHLLVAYPSLCRHQPFIEWTDNIIWRNNPEQLLAWQQGKTGYPIVDAAMRQLNTLGWMHNRLRMITASFLVKDLLIDWREGERYFMSQLLDGDLAANNGGWQWAASTGTDAAPYFRIFNPTTQGERFDPHGVFIRRWLPELQHVPDKFIHQPHEWAIKFQQQLDYPAPIVEHKWARQQTLDAFETARKQMD